MEYIKATIKPLSPFGTEPMSDTLFGQLVWILSDMGENISDFLKDYDTNPFLVVSDFLPNNCGISPKIPVKYKLEESKEIKLAKILERKKIKSKNRIYIDSIYKESDLNTEKIINLSENINAYKNSEIIRCSIDRRTGTTGQGFDPYSIIEYVYYGEITFSFYFYVSKEEHIDIIKTALEIMGKIGFGKDASLGRGQFNVENYEEVRFSNKGKNSIYTLGNCALEDLQTEGNEYYEIFTKYGKHGNIRSVEGNPFKNPVVMARQGALFVNISNKLFEKPYIGKALTNLSYYKDTVQQGYSLYVPVSVEVQ
ncbi:MAG: hypothetical protein JG767_1616 [Deferribacteraceae bacterium]|jgi:CRISPR-associated protein Csm4|nr:hypothetical protein [Deferribacteraceae bacterium]